MREIKAEDILKKFHQIAAEYNYHPKKKHWKDITLDPENEQCIINKEIGARLWTYQRNKNMCVSVCNQNTTNTNFKKNP